MLREIRVALCGALALLCGAAATAAQAAGPSTEVRLWHAMAGTHGASLDALVARFNASQSDARVVARYMGPYEATMRATLAARGAQAPHLAQVFEVGTAEMLAARDAVRPVWRVMVEAGQPLQHDAFVPAIGAYFGDARGRLLALPFNVSTPVLLVNRDALRRAKLDPGELPKSWYEMPKLFGALADAGTRCGMTTTWPSWVLIENMGAWHNQPFATEDNGLDGLDAKLVFNSRLMVRWVSMLATWVKAGYFSWSGRRDGGVARFLSGECALLLASSSAYDDLKRRAGFDLGVAQLPYYDDYPEAPQNSLIGGAGLWVLGGKTRTEYRAVARFLGWVASPEVQAAWHQQTGYLPVTRAAYRLSDQAGFYVAHPGQQVAIRQLLLRNPTRQTKGIRIGHFLQVREAIEEELEAVWGGRKSAIDALDSAVQRGNALLESFERANVPAGTRTPPRRAARGKREKR